MQYSSFRTSRPVSVQPPGRRTKLIAVLKKHKRKLLTVFLLVFAIGVLSWLQENSPASRQTATGDTMTKPKPRKIRVIATGDTIAHDALNQAALQADGSYDYYQFMKPLKPYFDSAGVRFCNQAVPGGGPEFGIRGYPVFNSPLEVAKGMNQLGCNVVNTGTNHTFDFGQPVIDAELNYWDKLPNMLAVAGANRSAAEQQMLRTFEVHGVTFAFLSYTTYSNEVPPNSYGLNMYSAQTAQQQLEAARQKADIVMVSMRWGTEYSVEINPEQTKISQQLADWGADIVLGHGPHVLQPVKQLLGKDSKKTLVWYSLGNFLNAQIQTESLISGLATMDIDLQTKKLDSPKLLPTYMHYEWTAEQKAREDLRARRNFTIVPLDTADALLARSQTKTSVSEQTSRVSALLNQYTPVTILKSADYK